MLFNLTDSMVWSKAVKDTSGLEAFYNNNPKKYTWQERANTIIYKIDTTVNAKTALTYAKMVAKGSKAPEYLKTLCDTSNANCIKITSGLYEKDDKKIEGIKFKKGAYEKENGTVVVITEIRAAEPKKLNEARGLITADYQNYLESKWIEQLRASYNIKVNENILEEIKTSL
ncbi:MAG: hypothetical protein HC896_02815 [Bacteroidales bacterium]|nr:hypothetical protein [Bacteroidales bacterium]